MKTTVCNLGSDHAEAIDYLAADAVEVSLDVSLVLGWIVQEINKHLRAWSYYKLSHIAYQSTFHH